MLAILAGLFTKDFLFKNWKLIAIGLALIAVFSLWQMDRRAQFNAGKAEERAASLERASKLIRERMKNDAEISRMSDRDLCIELGGQWMPDGTCD